MTPWDVYWHGVVEVLASKRTSYQDMHIVRSGSYGKALVLDGKWQSSTGDEFLYHEALVQPAMIAHGRARRALVLGGGEGATIREALRWKSVERVVMVDLDGDVVEACREHLPEMHQGAFDDPRLELVIGDAVEFLETNDEVWDIVISDLTDPIEDGPSYPLFTREYFEKIRRLLAPEGRLVVQAGPVSPFEIKLHARLVNTLRAVFSHVHPYVSNVPTYGSPWGFALCSVDVPVERTPDPDRVDRELAERTTGGLRLIDGATLLGMMQTPTYIRRAVEAESMVYTLSNPPKFFGSGIVK
jgi:spermidine synthase